VSPSSRACLTCWGEGEISTENGPDLCPDCQGDGKQPAAHELAERRLRDLEVKLASQEDDDGGEPSDLRWLVHELRAARKALMHIFTVCHDNGDDPPVVRDIKFLANDALGLFEKHDL